MDDRVLISIDMGPDTWPGTTTNEQNVIKNNIKFIIKSEK